jgi:hypothetical protein
MYGRAEAPFLRRQREHVDPRTFIVCEVQQRLQHVALRAAHHRPRGDEDDLLAVGAPCGIIVAERQGRSIDVMTPERGPEDPRILVVSRDHLGDLDVASQWLDVFDVIRLMTDPEFGRGPSRIVAADAAHAVHAPLRLGFFTLAQVFSRAGGQKVLAGLVPLWAPLDNLIYRDAGIVGLRVLEIRPAVVLQRPTPTLTEGRFEDAAARAVKRPLKIELRRKLFLVARRFRAVRSYARAWGLRGLCKLRPGW